MNGVFVDTSAFNAFNNPKDQYHSKSKELLGKIIKNKLTLVTTDYVIDEATTLLLTRSINGYKYALNLLDTIFKSNYQLEWIGKRIFFSAKKVFGKYNRDKVWSFTDCTSYVVIKELGIKTAFTFDDHFKQMGLRFCK